MALDSLLPPELAERACWLKAGEAAPTGRYVLYWLRVAQRLHDNPALLAAQALATTLDQPLLIYQGLDERYPYASDRHHRFILEGARAVEAEAKALGLTYVFHLARQGHRSPRLQELAKNACAVVTELFPWRPIARWTEQLAKDCPGPVLTVDSACLVPMPQTRAQDTQRAFRFRDRYAARREEALLSPWPSAQPHAGPDGLHPFEPVSLQKANLDELIAHCAIDHGVAPVAAYPGGSAAGYERWEGFKAAGLRTYHRRRNNPLEAGGVSGLSPYLHYGQISPFRLAREAAALGGAGAEKYLDELLIWRELAWAFCYHEPHHETLAAIPAWARETLAERPPPTPESLKSYEALRSAKSGEPLWDSAQRALLRQGMLHNNLRMSWGKQILPWSPDGAQALARLIDLNHRYALDGRDPSSYGGLLWCLGAFDRPFTPPAPGFGTIRPRSTETHRDRLDPAAFAEACAAPNPATPPSVAILGAGLAGLTCAQALSEQGWNPTLFDKGRRPGGRLATRESRHSTLAFNHGAQEFEAQDPRFKERLTQWAESGWAVPTAQADRWSLAPRAASLPEALAEGLLIHCRTRIVGLHREGEQWSLEAESGRRYGPFESLVITLPPAQLAELMAASALPDLESLAQAAREAKAEGAWAFMTALEEEPKGLAEGAWPGTLRLSKPQQNGKRALTAILPEALEGANLESTPEAMIATWAPRLAEALGQSFPTESITAHRWRYANFTAPAPCPVWHPALGLALAGDGYALEDTTAEGVEAAYLGGRAAAGRLIAWALARSAAPSAPVSPRAQANQGSLF